jgi:hypothetical protein
MLLCSTATPALAQLYDQYAIHPNADHQGICSCFGSAEARRLPAARTPASHLRRSSRRKSRRPFRQISRILLMFSQPIHRNDRREMGLSSWHDTPRQGLGRCNGKRFNRRQMQRLQSTAVSRALHGNGAAEGTRTPDPIITNDVLYQLSYCGIRADVSAQIDPRKTSLRRLDLWSWQGESPPGPQIPPSSGIPLRRVG